MKKISIKIFALSLAAAALCLASCSQTTDSEFSGRISGAMSPYETKEVTLNGRILSWDKVDGLDRDGVRYYEVYKSTNLLSGYTRNDEQPSPGTELSCNLSSSYGTAFYRIKTYFADDSSGPLSSAFATNSKDY